MTLKPIVLDNAPGLVSSVVVDKHPVLPPGSAGVYTKQLIEQDKKDLQASVLATDTVDEAIFFLDPLSRYGIVSENAMFFGGYNGRGELVGAMVISGHHCHVLWCRRDVLILFADILRRACTTVWMSGPKPLSEPFLEHFTKEEILFQQEGTTCMLTQQSMRPVRRRSTRRATLADVNRILAFEQWVRAHDGGERPAARERRRAIIGRVKAQTAYMAESDGTTVAVAYADIVLPQAAHVCEVATAPSYRNQGFGAACVAALCTALLTRTERIFLTYANSNGAAARAYDKIGFLPHQKRLRAHLAFAVR